MCNCYSVQGCVDVLLAFSTMGYSALRHEEKDSSGSQEDIIMELASHWTCTMWEQLATPTLVLLNVRPFGRAKMRVCDSGMMKPVEKFGSVATQRKPSRSLRPIVQLHLCQRLMATGAIDKR